MSQRSLRNSGWVTFNVSQFAYGIIDDNLPEYAIIAIFAIREAWNALRDIFIYGIDEESVETIKRGQVATSLLSRAQQMESELKLSEMRHLADKGEKFTGHKGPRIDVLSSVIEKTFLDLKQKYQNPSAKNVFDALPINDYIQEKEDNVIYWINRHGKQKKTEFKSFKNRLTKIKKSIKSRNLHK